MNLLSVTHGTKYTWYFVNSLWLYHLYRKCTICPLIHYEFTMNLSPLSATITFYLLRIHYLIRESSINLLFSRKHYEFPTFYANSLWIYFVFRDSQWIHYLFREVTMNSLSFSQNNHKLTICFAILIRIHLMFPAFTMNSVGVSRIYFQFTIYFANSLWIRFVFRESTLDLLSIS